MNWVTSSGWKGRRTVLPWLCVLAIAAGMLSSRAYTTALFVGVQSQVTNDLAILGAVENPSRTERALLRTLSRASNVFLRVSQSDGKTLRSLHTLLGRKATYAPALSNVASTLLAGFNSEHVFVGNLLLEVPASRQATSLNAQYRRLGSLARRLNSATSVATQAALYDSAKRRLDSIFAEAVDLLIIPFPTDLDANSVSAKINGVNFRTSAGASSDSLFEAVATETNITVTLGALLNSGSGPRGILFSVPNAQFGAFRYSIPDSAIFTNRTGVYSPSESNVGATNGSIFVSTTATEVYGSFSCSGPDFTVTDGRFRISIAP